MNGRTIAAACIVLGLACPGHAADTALTFSSLFGTWKVVRMVGATEITGDDASAKAGLGAIITISAGLISNTYEPSSTCQPRKPTIVLLNTETKLEADYGTKGSGLDLPSGVLKPRMPFMDAGCATALILNRDELVWTLANGYIYVAKREAARAEAPVVSPASSPGAG